jgi:hypothetical protein
MDRRILVEGPMSPQLVIVGSILPQNPAQMDLAQDDDMVYTLAPDRSDEPFGKAVLPRRGWCNRLVSDAHGLQSAFNGSAVDAISITDEVVRSLIPGERLRYLPRDPSAVGFVVTLIQTRSLRSSRTMTRPSQGSGQ